MRNKSRNTTNNDVNSSIINDPVNSPVNVSLTGTASEILSHKEELKLWREIKKLLVRPLDIYETSNLYSAESVELSNDILNIIRNTLREIELDRLEVNRKLMKGNLSIIKFKKKETNVK